MNPITIAIRRSSTGVSRNAPLTLKRRLQTTAALVMEDDSRKKDNSNLGVVDDHHCVRTTETMPPSADWHRPLRQKTIGLLGGCSNVATMEYYKFLNDTVNQRLGGFEIAETLIAGMNFGNIEAFVRRNDWDGLRRYMQGKIEGLVAGGADVVICSSNTLHKTLEGLMMMNHTNNTTSAAAVPIVPWIHIADPTGKAMQAQGLKKVALFGTRPTMQDDYFKTRYWELFGVEAIAPTEEEQHDIDQIIFDELCKDVLRKESKARYLEIVERMRRDDGVEGLILGCTEIFLLLDQTDMPDFPMFNTGKLHCEAAVDFALANTSESKQTQ